MGFPDGSGSKDLNFHFSVSESFPHSLPPFIHQLDEIFFNIIHMSVCNLFLIIIFHCSNSKFTTVILTLTPGMASTCNPKILH